MWMRVTTSVSTVKTSTVQTVSRARPQPADRAPAISSTALDQ